jgi:hypothetical protein
MNQTTIIINFLEPTAPVLDYIMFALLLIFIIIILVKVTFGDPPK